MELTTECWKVPARWLCVMAYHLTEVQLGLQLNTFETTFRFVQQPLWPIQIPTSESSSKPTLTLDPYSATNQNCNISVLRQWQLSFGNKRICHPTETSCLNLLCSYEGWLTAVTCESDWSYHFTRNQVTNSMMQGFPLKVYTCSAVQEIICFIEPQVSKTIPSGTILNHLNSVHIFTRHSSFKSIITLFPSTSKYGKFSLKDFRNKILFRLFSSPLGVLKVTSISSSLDLINQLNTTRRRKRFQFPISYVITEILVPL